MSRQIADRSQYINIIKNGQWIATNDTSELNDVARYIVSFIRAGFLGEAGGWNGFLDFVGASDRIKAHFTSGRKYQIKNFYITSMLRAGESSAHGLDKAVDFVIDPLPLMPIIFNDIAKIGGGCNIYIAAPMSGGSVQKHIHFDKDSRNHQNYKAIESEFCNAANGYKLTQINSNSAAKVLDAYGLGSSSNFEKYKNQLLDQRSGGSIVIADKTTTYAKMTIAADDAIETTKQAVGDTVDALKKAGSWLGENWQKVAFAGAALYIGYKLIDAGALDAVMKRFKNEKNKPEIEDESE